MQGHFNWNWMLSCANFILSFHNIIYKTSNAQGSKCKQCWFALRHIRRHPKLSHQDHLQFWCMLHHFQILSFCMIFLSKISTFQISNFDTCSVALNRIPMYKTLFGKLWTTWIGMNNEDVIIRGLFLMADLKIFQGSWTNLEKKNSLVIYLSNCGMKYYCGFKSFCIFSKSPKILALNIHSIRNFKNCEMII